MQRYNESLLFTNKKQNYFEQKILPYISKNVDRSNKIDTISLNSVIDYSNDNDLFDTLLMCIQKNIDTYVVWEELKNILPRYNDMIDEVEVSRNIEDLKKIKK